MNKQVHFAIAAALVFGLAHALGCASEDADAARLRGGGSAQGDGDGGAGSDTASAAAGLVACTPTGRSYPGFDATPLESDRVAGTLGGDRDRIKPYTALKSELARVLGAPVTLTSGAFGEEPANADAFENHYHDGPPDRQGQPKPKNVSTWFTEPTSGALELYSTLESAFAGCTTYVTKNPAMAAAPTADTANAQCAAMARAFWSRTPTPAEIGPCVTAATTGAAAETEVHAKWAWGCTSLATSANFLAY